MRGWWLLIGRPHHRGVAFCWDHLRLLPNTGCLSRPSLRRARTPIGMSGGSALRSTQTRAPGLPVVRTLIRIAAAIEARRGRVGGEGPPRLPAFRPSELISRPRMESCRSPFSGSAARRILRCIEARMFSCPAARSLRCSSRSCPVPTTRTCTGSPHSVVSVDMNSIDGWFVPSYRPVKENVGLMTSKPSTTGGASSRRIAGILKPIVSS